MSWIKKVSESYSGDEEEKEPFTVHEINELFRVLYKLENYLEQNRNENSPVVTKVIRSLNDIGVRENL